MWVFAEQRYGKLKPVALELLGKAEELAAELNTHVTAVILGVRHRKPSGRAHCIWS
ncbi:hypothetical protein RBQ61_17575 [Sedimentibacter sp. MB35-C1]|nr:hypothetical protein [Sedimentibacter sp. MB35-C1]WMJ79058.1 hypothetical protein RBQ61_17575 [Sedimentibacter sp. MB35-C1]